MDIKKELTQISSMLHIARGKRLWIRLSTMTIYRFQLSNYISGSRKSKNAPLTPVQERAQSLTTL